MGSSMLYGGLEGGALGGLLYEPPSPSSDLLASNDFGGPPKSPTGLYGRYGDVGNFYDAGGRLVQLQAPEVFVFPNSSLTPEQRQLIISIARTYVGVLYRFPAGAMSSKAKGGDCSGLTWCIYRDANFYYRYTPSSGFANSPYFREITAPQQADLVVWPSNHVAIYDPMLGDRFNIWTTRSSMHVFGQGNTNMWSGSPKYYEYIVGR